MYSPDGRSQPLSGNFFTQLSLLGISEPSLSRGESTKVWDHLLLFTNSPFITFPSVIQVEVPNVSCQALNW